MRKAASASSFRENPEENAASTPAASSSISLEAGQQFHLLQGKPGGDCSRLFRRLPGRGPHFEAASASSSGESLEVTVFALPAVRRQSPLELGWSLGTILHPLSVQCPGGCPSGSALVMALATDIRIKDSM